MKKLFSFISEAKVELSRVNWPTRKQIFQYTLAVILISFAVAVFLGSLDFLFSYLVETFLLQ
ncbi:MAG: preprotein translocase subunit SecE [Patescibacteria group bacterium]